MSRLRPQGIAQQELQQVQKGASRQACSQWRRTILFPLMLLEKWSHGEHLAPPVMFSSAVLWLKDSKEASNGIVTQQAWTTPSTAQKKCKDDADWS